MGKSLATWSLVERSSSSISVLYYYCNETNDVVEGRTSSIKVDAIGTDIVLYILL